MADVCVDNRFELIAKYKAKLIEATNIETNKAEMDVIDNVLFRIWQMGWLDRLEQTDPLERIRGMSDLIDRQAAIEAMLKLQAEDEEAYGCSIPECFDGERAKEALEQLPSAKPQRKKGKWIKMSDAYGIYWCCSECGENIPRVFHFDREYDLFPSLKSIEKTNFCQNCGADMKGEEE